MWICFCTGCLGLRVPFPHLLILGLSFYLFNSGFAKFSILMGGFTFQNFTCVKANCLKSCGILAWYEISTVCDSHLSLVEERGIFFVCWVWSHLISLFSVTKIISMDFHTLFKIGTQIAVPQCTCNTFTTLH